MKKRDVNYIGGEYKVVQVNYLESTIPGGTQGYNFKIDAHLEPQLEQLAVVEDVNGFSLVQITAIYDLDVENAEEFNKAAAWVVDLVDTTAQDARREATEQRAFILTQLEERKKAFDATRMYEIMADNDPMARELLNKLRTIDGTSLPDKPVESADPVDKARGE